MNCPLCGHNFVEYVQACQTCPLNSGCNLVCCPNCGYKFPQESKIVNFFFKKLKKDKKNAKT